MIRLTISENEAGQRLDKLLFKYLNAAPKSLVYKLLRKKAIKRNGGRAEGSEILAAGDELTLFLADETLASLRCAPGTMRREKRKENNKDAKRSSIDRSSIDHSSIGHNSADKIRTDKRNISQDSTKQRETERIRTDSKKIRARIDAACTILYEDEQVIIAGKKAGVLSQKSKPSDDSLNEILRDYVLTKQAEEQSEKQAGEQAGEQADARQIKMCDFPLSLYQPSVCNRLDRNTTGLLLFAKTYAASRAVQSLLLDRRMKKYYAAVVAGKFHSTEPVQIDGWLKKDAKTNRVFVTEEETEGAVRIETAYRPLCTAFLERCQMPVTLLEVELLTGKSHQIRAHLAAIGHPIAGDGKYGDTQTNAFFAKRFGVSAQLLHAWKLDFPKEMPHPLEALSGRKITAPIPFPQKLMAMFSE